MTPRFFIPNYELTKSIIEYANGRIIIDLGCGSDAEFIQDLLKEGAKSVIGCDLFLDYTKVRAKTYQINSEASVHLFPGSIEENFSMLSMLAKHPKGALFLLCRPCHHYELIDDAIAVSGDQEILYIGLEKNIEHDLSDYKFEQIELNGSSEDNEVILKIIK